MTKTEPSSSKQWGVGRTETGLAGCRGIRGRWRTLSRNSEGHKFSAGRLRRMCTDEGESPACFHAKAFLSLFVSGEEEEGALLAGDVDFLGPRGEDRKDSWHRGRSGCKPLGGGTALGRAPGSFAQARPWCMAASLCPFFPATGIIFSKRF